MPAPRTLPDGIEVFRAGSRRAENGVVYQITRDDLARSAAAYRPDVHEAPLTVGHPADNLPAYGWVSALQVDGDVLKTTHRQVEPQFAEMVADGRFKHRSAAFYTPDDPTNPVPGTWYLRHVAYLGAQPPAVKGLKPIAFIEHRAVNFSESIPPNQEPPEMTLEEMQAQLDAEKKARAAAEEKAAAEAKRATAAEAQVATFSEQTTKQRHDANVAFCETQVQAGTLLPKDKAAAVAVLDQLSSTEVVEFSEGTDTKRVAPAEFVRSLIQGAKPKVTFGEHAPGNTGTPAALAAKGDSDADIDRKARAYMVQHKVNYSEAITAVTASFSA